MSKPRRSFESLWQELAPRVRIAALRIRSRDPALDADDLLQEVRIRLWQVWQRDRKSQFSASYYFRAVNSAMIDALRRHRGTMPGAERVFDPDQDHPERLESGEPDPSLQFDRAQLREQLETALADLPATRRRAVRLFLQGFTVPEIARLMGCDENRAHNLTYRGIRSLKQRMKST